MSAGGWMMLVAIVVALVTIALLLFVTVKSILNERSKGRSIWREFSLGLVLMILFFGTWLAHGIAQWQTYTDEQRAHNESTQIGDFVSQFSESTLENWQSEFLQLFSFVALSAIFIHKGSAESKDGTDKVEAALRRIEERLGTLPPDAPDGEGERWKLPETPLRSQDYGTLES